MLAPVGRESNLRMESILVRREGILASSVLAPEFYGRCHHLKPRTILGWAAGGGSNRRPNDSTAPSRGEVQSKERGQAK